MYYFFGFALLAICAYTALFDKAEYHKFETAPNSPQRINYYRRWILKSWAFFGLAALVTLFALGQTEFILRPIIATGTSAVIPEFVKTDADAFKGFITGFAIGVIILLISLIIRARKMLAGQSKRIGNYSALLPQNAGERKYAVTLCLSAGINEELFFRAALPVALLGIVHNSGAAIALSIIIFGLVHIYQGWKGILGTAVLGWIFMKVFLVSGNILVPMALHAFIDLLSLVLVPLLLRRKTGVRPLNLV